MEAWLAKALDGMTLSSKTEDYLLGRAARPEVISQMGLKTWSWPDEEAPDPGFSDKYSRSFLEGRMVYPIRSPRGDLIGFQARDTDRKGITRYLLPRAKWNPIWMGIDLAMPLIWAGDPVWIVEGLFDLFALSWAFDRPVPILGAFRAKITDKQIEFLRRFCTQVYVVFDNDKTGRQGSSRAISELSRVNLSCRDVVYQGKDPGEIWSHYGERGLSQRFAPYTSLIF